MKLIGDIYRVIHIGIMWRLLGPQTPELVTQVYKDCGMQRRLHIDVEYDYGGTVTDLCTMDA